MRSVDENGDESGLRVEILLIGAPSDAHDEERIITPPQRGILIQPGASEASPRVNDDRDHRALKGRSKAVAKPITIATDQAAPLGLWSRGGGVPGRRVALPRAGLGCPFGAEFSAPERQKLA